ncbi:hypothetical protein M9980_11095 [Sphingomonas donggukensis]|uniref:Uncharacterized protein n=1 Tax=Sphingomonas donggukensis TaxID=2949093 RepID=A0ABY4TT29_9SPHN|nr:hypothetical protein [Sphingomonas donggukensis]URW75099.1 hypothetical protein M9980_11095 [Sphingomonas donggukensis]
MTTMIYVGVAIAIAATTKITILKQLDKKFDMATHPTLSRQNAAGVEGSNSTK